MKKENKPDFLQDETLAQKLITKGFWLYLFSYLIAPGGYLIRLMISNSPHVSVEDVGVLYSIIGLVSFLNVYNDLGLTESLQYFLPKFWIKKQYNHIKTTILLSLGVQILTSLLIIIGLWRGNEWLANNYFHSEQASTILNYFCLYFLGINIFQTLQSIFIAFQRTFDYQFIEFVKMWSIVGFTAFCFFTGRQSIERYSLNWLIGLVIGILIGGFFYFKNYRSALMQGKFERDKSMMKEYSRYALWAFVGANVGNLFAQIIQQMVIYYLGAEAAGYYANFLSLFMIGNVILGPIMGLIFPVISELIEKKDHQKVGFLLSVFYSYFSVIVLSIGVLFIVLGPELAQMLLGERYLISGEILSYCGIFLIFYLLSALNFSILGGSGQIKIRVIILGISTFITILITFFALKLGGVWGAGIAFGMSYLLLRLLSGIVLRRDFSFSIDSKFLLRNIILLSIMGGCIILIKRFFVLGNSRGDLLCFLGGAGILYLLGFLFCNIKKLKELLTLLKHIKD